MNKTEGTNLRVVFYEGPGSAPLASEDRFQAISSLLEHGFEVTRPAAGGAVARADAAPILALGKFERGQAPSFGGEGEFHARDVSGLNAEAILGAAREIRDRSGARKLEAWKPWFPVID